MARSLRGSAVSLMLVWLSAVPAHAAEGTSVSRPGDRATFTTNAPPTSGVVRVFRQRQPWTNRDLATLDSLGLAEGTSYFVHGYLVPDGAAGTDDDLNGRNIDLAQSCYIAHGNLMDGNALPPTARYLMTARFPGGEQPIVGEFCLGSGLVIADTVTKEFGGQRPAGRGPSNFMRNLFSYAIGSAGSSCRCRRRSIARTNTHSAFARFRSHELLFLGVRPTLLDSRLPAPVAQWTEHLTTDQKVGGSTPSRRACACRVPGDAGHSGVT